MEAVYLKNYNSAVTENVCFADFFREYYLSVSADFYMDKPPRHMICRFLECGRSEYNSYVKKCNPHFLFTQRPKRDTKFMETNKGFRKGFHDFEIPEECGLKSLEFLRKRTATEKVQFKKLVKYPGQINLDPGDDESKMSTANALERFKEFILTVRIYVPWKHRAGKYVKAGGKFPQASQEFLIPGNMTLDKLRDRIGCPEDFQDMNTDISENPLQPISIRSGDVYKSAMFYIGNVFYIDTRHSDNIDYSEVVKKWAVRKKINLHRTEIMEKTCVNSLVARLGYPYLYVHQGCCEHLIVITDARLLNTTDVRILDDYPIMSSYAAIKGKYCDLCFQRVSKFAIFDNPDLTYDISLLCTTCTFLYNYSGYKKLNDFKLLKYIDRLAVL